jgi:hypothetical protein
MRCVDNFTTMLSPIAALFVAGVTETDNAPEKNVNRWLTY